jgi:hypothetical protein
LGQHTHRGKQFGSYKQICLRLPIGPVTFLEEESKERNMTVSAIVREYIDFFAFKSLWKEKAKRLAEYFKEEHTLQMPQSIRYERDEGLKSKSAKDSPIRQLLESMDDEMNEGIKFLEESIEFQKVLLDEMIKKREAISTAKNKFVGDIVKIVGDIANTK